MVKKLFLCFGSSKILMWVPTTAVLHYRNGHSVGWILADWVKQQFLSSRLCSTIQGSIQWDEYVTANVTNGASFYAHRVLCLYDSLSGVVTGTRLSNPSSAGERKSVVSPLHSASHQLTQNTVAHNTSSTSLCDWLPVSHGTKLVICSWVNRLFSVLGKCRCRQVLHHMRSVAFSFNLDYLLRSFHDFRALSSGWIWTVLDLALLWVSFKTFHYLLIFFCRLPPQGILLHGTFANTVRALPLGCAWRIPNVKKKCWCTRLRIS